MSGNNQRNINMDWLYSLERASKIIWYLEFSLKHSGEKSGGGWKICNIVEAGWGVHVVALCYST